MKATRDIRPGETLMSTMPSCVGPRLHQPTPCCLGCHSAKSKLIKCTKCGLDICSSSCAKTPAHQGECDLLAGHETVHNLGTGCVTPLRIIALRDTDPSSYETVLSMEANLEELKSRPLWNYLEANVIHPVLSLKIENISVDIVEKIVGILLSNTFEVVGSGCLLFGLFFPPAMMNHHCVGNVRITLDNSNKMTVYASRQIKKNTPIKFNYGRALDTTWTRQLNLMENKFFTCGCERCLDPSELGSNISSLKCIESDCGGPLLPSNPLSMKQDWRCSECNLEVKAEDVRNILRELQKDTAGLNSNNLKEVMRVLNKFSQFLHPNHGVLTELKQFLISGLGRLPGYAVAELKESDHLQKINLCKQVLEVLDVVDPGLSLGRGLMLFELHSTLVLVSNMEFEKTQNAQMMLSRLLEAETYLTEAARILTVEPSNSPYGQLASSVKHSMSDLTQYIQSIQSQAM